MKIVYEITGGIVGTPERGSIVIPPEETGRKDLEVGEMVLTRAIENSSREEEVVGEARRNGITEIPPVMTVVEKDSGR